MTETLWQKSIQAMMQDRLPNQHRLQDPSLSSEDGEEIAANRAFGEALVKFGSKYRNVVVLDANSSKFAYTAQFAQAFPERYANFGNAEQNVVSAAAGFTVRGKVPFVTMPAMRAAGRAWEQIRNAIAYPLLNVKIIGTHAGVFDDENPIYQALEDLAIMRAIPGMKVLCPADAVETRKMVEAMMNDYGPTYLRLGASPLPALYGADYQSEFGRGHVYKPGTDVCMFAIGTGVHAALRASELLEREGIAAMVVNISCLRPLDENLIVECAKQAQHIVTIEDHHIVGGLGSAVMETLSTYYPMKVLRIGLENFGESGKPDDLYRKYGLDPVSVAERVMGEVRARRVSLET